MDLVPLKKHSLTPAQFEQLVEQRFNARSQVKPVRNRH